MQIRVKQAIDEAVPPPYEEKERILVGTAQCTGIAGAPTLLAPIRTDLQRERQWLKEEQQRLEGAQTELNEQQCNLDQGIRKFEQRQGSEKRPLTEEVHHALEKGRQDLENRRKAVKNREKEVMNRRQARENRRQALQRAERDAIAAALGKFRDSQVDDWKNQNTVAALLFSGALGFLSGSTVGHNTRALMLLGSVVALFSVMTGTAICLGENSQLWHDGFVGALEIGPHAGGEKREIGIYHRGGVEGEA
ncbi:hypothetical protein SAICODRAFT_64291 [Saitoella complicata NRRL Y-17804]|uniref:uncharacterized protein n=1 Tax=Saitoella complicata (strain BCRC 22490 / CBS 7301 / JCM 7358 / NBRC 10748 / NRRL Y-17804) TaxID=698492 RepID=UPI000866D70A|nr:uncharacterized protein SAICODRAFT_64291 [Saitoella complicata NRRL Y-17804]ODQ55050.1 hypothetical protein SAICODRAFT_64291 [Saitoella complicata NRRL Y-17804]